MGWLKCSDIRISYLVVILLALLCLPDINPRYT